MHILGELVRTGALASVAWAVRFIIRDVLAHCWRREVLRRTPEDQVTKVVTALAAKPHKARN